MTEPERRLAEDRQLRAEARGLFDTRLAQVRSDLAAKGVGGRIKDRAITAGADAIDHALDVARDNKAVVGATGAALGLWLLRRPITALLARAFGPRTGAVQPDEPSAANALTDREH